MLSRFRKRKILYPWDMSSEAKYRSSRTIPEILAQPICNDLWPWLTFRHHRRRARLIARYSMTSINRLYYYRNSYVLHYTSEIFIHLSRAWPATHPSAQKYKRDIFTTWTQSSLLNLFIHYSSRINIYQFRVSNNKIQVDYYTLYAFLASIVCNSRMYEHTDVIIIHLYIINI